MTRMSKIAAGTLLASAPTGNSAVASDTDRNQALVAQSLQAWADGSGSPYVWSLEQPDATTVIASGLQVHVDRFGNVIAERD